MNDLTVKRKGILTEEYLKYWFLSKGYSVSVPIGDDDKYDFIVDADGKLLKMQSKTSNLTRTVDSLNFASAAIHYNSSGTHRAKYSSKDIDYFCTLNPETKQVYIVPVEEVAGTEVNLHFSPPKNGNFKNYKMASDFEGEKIMERIIN